MRLKRFSDFAHFLEANNYLDDSLFVMMCEIIGSQSVNSFLEICQEINFPVSEEKTCWATQLNIFLGMGLDGSRQLILILLEKRQHALNELTKLIKKRTVTVHKLQQITGFF